MKNEKLTTFRKFNEQRIIKLESTKERKKQSKLEKLTEDYHQAQLQLHDLERKYVQSPKENKSEREELKKAIIDQKKVIGEKRTKFEKEIGNEDIQDLEIH